MKLEWDNPFQVQSICILDNPVIGIYQYAKRKIPYLQITFQ
jgi:hypothetical protein